MIDATSRKSRSTARQRGADSANSGDQGGTPALRPRRPQALATKEALRRAVESLATKEELRLADRAAGDQGRTPARHRAAGHQGGTPLAWRPRIRSAPGDQRGTPRQDSNECRQHLTILIEHQDDKIQLLIDHVQSLRPRRSGDMAQRFFVQTSSPVLERQTAGEFGRLQHARNAIDRLERLDLLERGRGLQLLELARLDQDVAFERSDGLVVGLEARLEPRAERRRSGRRGRGPPRTAGGRGR